MLKQAKASAAIAAAAMKPAAKEDGSKKPAPKPVGKPPAVKREASDIFKPFAKPKAKLSRDNTDTSGGASPKALDVQQVRHLPAAFAVQSLNMNLPVRRSQTQSQTVQGSSTSSLQTDLLNKRQSQ